MPFTGYKVSIFQGTLMKRSVNDMMCVPCIIVLYNVIVYIMYNKQIMYSVIRLCTMSLWYMYLLSSVLADYDTRGVLVWVECGLLSSDGYGSSVGSKYI